MKAETTTKDSSSSTARVKDTAIDEREAFWRHLRGEERASRVRLDLPWLEISSRKTR